LDKFHERLFLPADVVHTRAALTWIGFHEVVKKAYEATIEKGKKRWVVGVNTRSKNDHAWLDHISKTRVCKQLLHER
jgi:hypothetical protein